MDKKDRKALLDQIERWHRKDGAHQQIVDAIEALPAAEREQTRWQTLYRWGEDIVLLSADRSLTEDQLAAIRAGLTRWFGGGGG